LLRYFESKQQVAAHARGTVTRFAV
jgi:hypothetical protein